MPASASSRRRRTASVAVLRLPRTLGPGGPPLNIGRSIAPTSPTLPLAMLFFVGCTVDDPTTPRSVTPPLPVEVARDELIAYFTHLEASGADPTDPVAVHRASVEFVDMRYTDRPAERRAGQTYLWNLEDADPLVAGRIGQPSRLPSEVVREADEVFSTASDPADVLAWIRSRRRSSTVRPIPGNEVRVLRCYFDLLERVTLYVRRVLDRPAAGYDRDPGRARCLLSTFGGSITALISGVRSEGALGSGEERGAIVDGPVGGVVGAMGGATIRATAGCFAPTVARTTAVRGRDDRCARAPGPDSGMPRTNAAGHPRTPCIRERSPLRPNTRAAPPGVRRWRRHTPSA